MEQAEILTVLNSYYPMYFDSLEFMRDAGSISYIVFSNNLKYFLRITKPVFFDTVIDSINIHIFLQKQGFPVPPIIFTNDNKPYVKLTDNNKGYLCILYEFIEGDETDPEQDAEAVGSLIGKLHSIMRAYPSSLAKMDRYYYIDRYIEILQKKQYPKTDKFADYGTALWKKVKALPYGYCHGDMYRGNTHKASLDGRIYILDFDTSCKSFPMYDIVLYCNMTNYFKFQKAGYKNSQKVLKRFLTKYLKYSPLTQNEINAFFNLIALYHFALQATVIENYGLDCVDDKFLDNQLDWLYRWHEQCEQNRHTL